MEEIRAKNGEVLKFDEPYYSKAKCYGWRSTSIGDKKYYYTYFQGKTMSLSKVVFDIEPDQIVFHKNGISEDFTNDNIVICSRKDVWNVTDKKCGKTSKYYGVTWFKHNNRWGVEQERGESIRKRWLFREEAEAALWADYRNIKRLGDKAKRNFPGLSSEQLQEKINELMIKYGETYSEKMSKTRQGNTYCKKKTTPYRGVSKSGNKYVAQICYKNKREVICRTDDPIEAAKAYNKRAIELFGKYAKINDIE